MTSRFEYSMSPLVAKNPFLEQSAQGQAVPEFTAVKPHLPIPILPRHPDWVTLYWRTWEMMWRNLCTPLPSSKLTHPFFDPMFNKNTFMWDTAFLSQVGVYARRAFEFQGGLNNFYGRQHANGFICRELSKENGDDYFLPFDPNATGPNILGWAEWRLFRATGDNGRLQDVFWPLVALHRWFRAHRTWQNGLYWATGMSSGMDNQPRVPDSSAHHQHWSWIDASMQAAVSCAVLEQMATLLKATDISIEMSQERTRLSEQINQTMWSEAARFYLDVDANGHYSPVKSIGAFWGLQDKRIVPEKRMQPFINHLRENWSFKLTHRIPSQSADSEGYNAMTGNYWRGAVWSSTNFMVLKGLRQVNQSLLAYEIARNHLENVKKVFQQTETLWENYAPETAAEGDPAKADFAGTTALAPISILLEDVIGIHVDWPQSRVYWERRLEDGGVYGVRNYPLGETGTMHLTGDEAKLVVETDVPFILVVRDSVQSLQTAVPAGTTEIDLT